MSPVRERLLRLYEAYNARDMEEILNYVHLEVSWLNGLSAGVIHGRDNLREHWKSQFPVIHIHINPLGFISEADGSVSVAVHITAHDSLGNLVVDSGFKHIFAFQDGLISRFEVVDAEPLTPLIFKLR